MVTIIDAKEPKRTGLEGLSRSELNVRLINEVFDYRTKLLSVSSEEGREVVIEGYMKRTESLRGEIDRREQLYLEGHKANIRY